MSASGGLPSRGLEAAERIFKKAPEPAKKAYEDSDSDSIGDFETFMGKDEGVTAPAPLPERQPRDFKKLLEGPLPPKE